MPKRMLPNARNEPNTKYRYPILPTGFPSTNCHDAQKENLNDFYP